MIDKTITEWCRRHGVKIEYKGDHHGGMKYKASIMAETRRPGYLKTFEGESSESDAVGALVELCADLHRHHPDKWFPPEKELLEISDELLQKRAAEVRRG